MKIKIFLFLLLSFLIVIGISLIKNDTKNSTEFLKSELHKIYKHKTESEITKITIIYYFV